MNLDIKYRPHTFEGFIGNKNIVKDMKAYLKTRDPPHMMFVGPPGCGKNTLAYIFATEYFGRPISLDTENSDVDYKELNASMERGIDVVRGEIEDFARTPSDSGEKRIIVLDEAESMTKIAQLALKSTIEKAEKDCIFIFLMNDEDGIQVDALKSRCAIYRFKRPEVNDLVDWFTRIAKEEFIKFEPKEIVLDIVKHYKGDCRKMLVDCLEPLRGYDHKTVQGPITDYILIEKEDLFKIYEGDTKSKAQIVFDSVDQKKMFFTIWSKESFNLRRFLEDYEELNDYKDARIAAIVDANLRMGGSEKLQMSYFFDSILVQGVKSNE